MRQLVATILRSHAPPEASDIFRTVVSTELETATEDGPLISAELIMFDGRKARVKLQQFSMAGCISWASEWTYMPGGACHWENGKWTRLDSDMQPVLPLFAHLT
jgi:hypothetical protein